LQFTVIKLQIIWYKYFWGRFYLYFKVFVSRYVHASILGGRRSGQQMIKVGRSGDCRVNSLRDGSFMASPDLTHLTQRCVALPKKKCKVGG
jgi:hypothetical protein